MGSRTAFPVIEPQPYQCVYHDYTYYSSCLGPAGVMVYGDLSSITTEARKMQAESPLWCITVLSLKNHQYHIFPWYDDVRGWACL